MWVRQSRIKPGSVGRHQPKHHIRHREARHHQEAPSLSGLGEHIEEYFYRQITNVRLEKGVMSASLGVLHTRNDRDKQVWTAGAVGGKGDRGTIDAIPKNDAERIYDYVRGKDPRGQGGRLPKTAGGRETKKHRRPACDSKGEVRQGRDQQGGVHDVVKRPHRPGIPDAAFTDPGTKQQLYRKQFTGYQRLHLYTVLLSHGKQFLK